MDVNLLDFIYEGYISYCLDYELNKKTEETKEFNKKYIKPLLKQNPEAGMTMEDMFNRALAETDIRAFKHGFRACMNFMVEYFKGDL